MPPLATAVRCYVQVLRHLSWVEDLLQMQRQFRNEGCAALSRCPSWEVVPGTRGESGAVLYHARWRRGTWRNIPITLTTRVSECKCLP
jgi:hypothetical protein